MGRNKKEELMSTIPAERLRRSDKWQYWLQQRDMPTEGSETWKKKLSVYDRLVINAIRMAESNATMLGKVMDEAHGKISEGADLTRTESNDKGAMFNIPKTVSELNKEKDEQDTTI